MRKLHTERSPKEFFSKADQGNRVAAGQGRGVRKVSVLFEERRNSTLRHSELSFYIWNQLLPPQVCQELKLLCLDLRSEALVPELKCNTPPLAFL